MGEVAVCGGGATEMMGVGVADTTELILRTNDDDGGGGPAAAATTGNVVRWEKFLPKMVLRVLLVEADDSTRQIITALLKKCDYKVAAVCDGLKAWEVLKERAHNIDLILTEVELPSISGFSLLTLIMEHEICKNIPVIMMSAHDSVSTVYKCMLRGAVDFLLKPLRKNELKNLWQHVWRRKALNQSIGGADGGQEESDTQQKVEATAENNETNNRSSGYIACIKRNRESIEKGSDAQSSCMKLDMDSEGPQAKDFPHCRRAKSPQKLEEYDKTRKYSSMQENEAEGTSAQEKDTAIDFRWQRVNVIVDNCNPSMEAIDLIGSFDSYPKSSLINGLKKVDNPSPLLDLSLRRSHPSSSVSQLGDERHKLKQSDASAFSRYINRTQARLPSGSPSISNQHKDYEFNSDKVLSKDAIEYDFNCHSMPGGSSQQNTIRQQGQTESQSQSQFHSQNGGTLSRLNSLGSASNGYGNLVSDGNNMNRREAALNKFRMKRKDRCFEKKVQYENRKKLAEQRPRVKGQFVRQTQTS